MGKEAGSRESERQAREIGICGVARCCPPQCHRRPAAEGRGGASCFGEDGRFADRSQVCPERERIGRSKLELYHPNTTPGTINHPVYLYGPHAFYNDMFLSKTFPVYRGVRDEDSGRSQQRVEPPGIWQHLRFMGPKRRPGQCTSQWLGHQRCNQPTACNRVARQHRILIFHEFNNLPAARSMESGRQILLLELLS